MKLNKKKLDISIIVGGRFHAFDLAQQLDKYNLLNCLVTTYPKFFLKKFNIDKKKIKNFFFIELIKRVSKRLLNLFNMDINDYFFNDHFDNCASNIDYKSNMIIGWSGFSKKTFLKNKNKILVLERGSSHILFQNQILKKAYEDLHIPYKSINEKLIKKELDEYEIADFISVPSIFAKNSFLEKKFLNTKLIQVPLGVNLNDFYRFKNKEKKNKLRIIYVGQLSVRKGIIYLLEAFDELTNTKKYNNIELVCIGDIDFEIEKKIKNFKKNNRIFFLGSKKQQDLINYYNSSDIFILPSLEEGLAMVQLQALACGVPVISTKNSGAEDIIENNTNGLIIEPFSVNDIKDKIVYFIENKQMISIFSDKAIESSKKFTWEIYSKKLINIYKNILAENNKNQ
jgi:glycosyltransferase involved in cell wall biosynthesis